MRKNYLLGRNYRQNGVGYAMMKLLQKTLKQILFYGPDHGIIKKEYQLTHSVTLDVIAENENSKDFGPLSEKVRYYKKDQKGKMIMCDKVQRLIDEASEEKDRKIAKVTMERNRAVAERKRMAAEKKRAVVENKRMAAEIKYLKAQLAAQESRFLF